MNSGKGMMSNEYLASLDKNGYNMGSSGLNMGSNGFNMGSSGLKMNKQDDYDSSKGSTRKGGEMNDLDADHLAKMFSETNKFSMKDIDMYLKSNNMRFNHNEDLEHDQAEDYNLLT